MAGEKMASKSSPNPTRVRKRVEVDSSPPASSVDASAASSLKRARDGSAFTKCEGCNKDVVVALTAASSLKRARDGSAFTGCEGCNKDVVVALIGFHNCSLDAKIKLNLEARVVDMPAEAKKNPAEKEEKNKDNKAETKEGQKSRGSKCTKTATNCFLCVHGGVHEIFHERKSS